MCGIYGWSFKPSNLPSSEKRYLLAALLGLYNDDRGGDSHGWYAPMAHAIYRNLGLVSGIARTASHHPLLIAHTRKATVGDKTVENSHPFVMGNIIGAHNGGVSNWQWRNSQQKTDYQVDSQQIFHALNEDKDLSELYGYGAIEWVDLRRPKGDILLCRISQHGDLGVARTEHGIIWSSAKSKLDEALFLCGMKAETWELKAEHVHVARNGILYETPNKLFFGSYTSQNSSTGGTTYGSSQVKREDDEDQSELSLLDAAAATIRKTIGKKKNKKEKQHWQKKRWCHECSTLDSHETWCPTVTGEVPNPRPTAPVSKSVVFIGRDSEYLAGSTVTCVSCHNEIKVGQGGGQHAGWCPVGRDRDVGGGVGVVRSSN